MMVRVRRFFLAKHKYESPSTALSHSRPFSGALPAVVTKVCLHEKAEMDSAKKSRQMALQRISAWSAFIAKEFLMRQIWQQRLFIGKGILNAANIGIKGFSLATKAFQCL